mmetsp:Transcript_80244/g.221895  ORF Transcript_80244/g.221895 Transcript_80244/m.221895 type:complete len:219 (+) Transcript_80244:326-982(+)
MSPQEKRTPLPPTMFDASITPMPVMLSLFRTTSGFCLAAAAAASADGAGAPEEELAPMSSPTAPPTILVALAVALVAVEVMPRAPDVRPVSRAMAVLATAEVAASTPRPTAPAPVSTTSVTVSVTAAAPLPATRRAGMPSATVWRLSVARRINFAESSLVRLARAPLPAAAVTVEVVSAIAPRMLPVTVPPPSSSSPSPRAVAKLMTYSMLDVVRAFS